MNVIRNTAAFQPAGRKVCVAIGVFDGVHLGHQQVIRQTLADAAQHEALAVVATFDRHPNAVVAPDRVPALIYSMAQKLRAIAALGVEATWLIEFDTAFSRQSGEEFVRGLATGFHPLQSICVGSEFTFGHRRSGDVTLLRKLGGQLSFSVHGLAAVSLDGQVVSSTRIREAIRAGDLDVASQMLGRGYALAGVVRRGDQLGRTMGFPTANVAVEGMVLPPRGVYAAHVLAAGKVHRAVVNLGVRPTVVPGEDRVRVEAHLLDFDGDLYGQEIEVSFGVKLREEAKFASMAALKDQIARDISAARRTFG